MVSIWCTPLSEAYDSKAVKNRPVCHLGYDGASWNSGHQGYVSSMRFMNDDSRLVSASGDSLLYCDIIMLSRHTRIMPSLGNC
jgi:hypothetical protein